VWLRDRGVNGSTELLEREAGSRLLEAQSGDVIICSKLDRMFRNARNALNVLDDLKSRGIELHFIDLGGSVSNGIGQLVFTILSAVAEQERSRIRERITEAKARQRSEGYYQGGKVAFGYRLNGNRVVEDEVQQKCLLVLQKKSQEGMSLRRLSRYINSEWRFTISHNTIRVILCGKRKIGLKSANTDNNLVTVDPSILSSTLP